MKRIIKLNERDLTRLVKRVIRESEEDTIEQSNTVPLPRCIDMMTDPPSGMMGGSSELDGPIDKITYNSTVSPQYQGYIIHKGKQPFCLIPK